MSSVVISETDPAPEAKPVDMKLEVVLLSVSDVDRAKAFYEKLGWRLDIDIAVGGFRGVQITPQNSDASIIFGKGITSSANGSAPGLVLAVDDIDVAREDLLARGVDVSEAFHHEGDVHTGTDEPYLFGRRRVSGVDPERGSYRSYASFSDPDGNGWLLQEVTARLPGRVAADSTTFASSVDLAAAFRRAAAAHGEHEERNGGQHDENWPDWYADYIVKEQAGEPLPV